MRRRRPARHRNRAIEVGIKYGGHGITMRPSRALSSLVAAIRRVYGAFAPYATEGDAWNDLREGLRKWGPEIACRTEDEARRRSHVSELNTFAFDVLLTSGDVEELKQLLPQLLEFLALERTALICHEVIGDRLRLAEWHTWPDEERAAVQGFFDAWWVWVLDTFPASGDQWAPGIGDGFRAEISTSVCTLANAFQDLRPFLGRWEKRRSVSSLRQLADFVLDNQNALLKEGQFRVRLANAFYEEREEQMEQVVRWLVREEIVQKFEAASFRYSRSPFAGEAAPTPLGEPWCTTGASCRLIRSR